MEKCLNRSEISALAQGLARRDNFGPDTEYPYLAFELDCDLDIADWLKDMPCPVIGVGRGGLEKACDVILPDTTKLPKLARNINEAPIAAMVLVQHLRASEHLSIREALTAESFAYGTVQTGPEFKRWLENYDSGTLPISDDTPLKIDIENTTLSLTMNRPDTRNAIGVDMRDALCEALDLALIAEGYKKVTLTGSGATFSTGGAIEEFGEIPDPASAHWVRSLRLPAWRLTRLNNLHVNVNGAAIGAGAEIAGFGTKVTASAKAWFQLPELKYGLIPGAGGTASLPRRIGRERTAYLALSMDKIKAQTALDWGLVDEIVED